MASIKKTLVWFVIAAMAIGFAVLAKVVYDSDVAYNRWLIGQRNDLNEINSFESSRHVVSVRARLLKMLISNSRRPHLSISLGTSLYYRFSSGRPQPPTR
jgi:hypothetical protein